MRSLAISLTAISLTLFSLTMVGVCLLVYGSSRLVSHADTVILKNGAVIHGKAKKENGNVIIDFGKPGKMSVAEVLVSKIIEDDLNDFTLDEQQGTPVPAAASKPSIIRLKKGTDRSGVGQYRGTVLPSQDDRVVRLRVAGGGVVKILREYIEKIEPDEDGVATPVPAVAGEERVIPTTHLVTLTNGRQVRGNVVNTPEREPLRLDLVGLGTLKFRRNQIEKVEAVAGSYELPEEAPLAEEEEAPGTPPEESEEALRKRLRDEILQDLLKSLIDRKIDAALDRGSEDLSLRSISEGLDERTVRDIQRHVRELARQRSRNRVRAENGLRRYGSLALPYLQPAANHPFELTRRAVQRLVRDAGDVRGAPYAIDALVDSDIFVRRHAHEALRSLLGSTVAYNPAGSSARRLAARRQYRELWEKLRREHLQTTAAIEMHPDAF